MASPQPRIGVVTYPGSQDDRDAIWALAALDAETVAVWHEEHELPDLDAVVLPGRLLLRRLPPLRGDRPLLARDRRGLRVRGGRRLVLGICNGFQILCEAGLLPGALLRNGVAPLRLPRRAVDGRAGRPAVHHALHRRRTARAAGEARRRPVPPAAGSRSHPGRAPLRRQPERIGRAASPGSATRPAT